jgi:lipoprotein-anchoring transpeptidase ErfK/SrfK
MRRVALSAVVLGLAGSGFVAASVTAGSSPSGGLTDTAAPTETTTTTTTTTETTPTTTPPKPKPKRTRLPARVTVGGVHVGGLSPKAAWAVVSLAFRSPLVLMVEDDRISVSPDRLGAKAYVQPAVSRALRARPGAAIPLFVAVRGADVRAYVAGLARKRDREVRDAKAVLRGLTPRIVEEREGFTIRRGQTVAAIVRALQRNRRGPVAVPGRRVRPTVRATTLRSVVVIRRSSKLLVYYRAEKRVRRFTVATGQAAFPTPLGSFHIVVKWPNPWWYPPPSPWAAGLEPVPPGPGNPLGTRWMGLDAPAVGIHGTPDAASLGYSASHGCIRMAIPSAEWLFQQVEIGTPVFIVDA